MGRSDARIDREQILEQAARARARRQRRRAIALYRQVLAVERNNVDLHEKLAPLLAESGQEFDAWNSYRAMAHAALREGREDRAIAVLRDATRAVPREIQAWQELARLLVRQDEPDAAIEVLLDGSRQFRAHWNHPQAIHLLRRARAIDPWHFETVIELAGHLGRADQEAEADLLLEALAQRESGRRLRRVRTAQLAVSPGLRTLLAWLGIGSRREVRSPQLEAHTLEPEAAPVAPVLTLAPASDPAGPSERGRTLRRVASPEAPEQPRGAASARLESRS